MAIIGIDLGTTNSLAAVWKDGEPVIIPNAHGERLTPSVVSIDDAHTVLTGASAKERLITFPDHTIASFKRNMGLSSYYQIHRKMYSAVDLSSLILSQLKKDAERFLAEPVTEAVISVPAYFNQNQRKATKRAGEMAGLVVERLVSEPTAAALFYGIDAQPDMKTALVFDLGGGTFDVSILEFFDGVVDVKAVSGDNHLGGEDFTRLISAWFILEHSLENKLSSHELSCLHKASEIAKQQITSNDVSGPQASGVQLELKGTSKTYTSTLTVSIFDALCADLLSRLQAPVVRALKDAGLHPQDIDKVILMGGATRMRHVCDLVHSLFPNRVITSYNPDETVALGAAVLAAMKAHHHQLKETVLTDICPFSLGIEVHQGDDSSRVKKSFFDPVIERNTPIPVSIVNQYLTSVPGQKQVRINVYQGESLKVSENLKLGEFCVDVPINPDGLEVIDVRFTYDINGLLEIEATIVSTGDRTSMVINQKDLDMSDWEVSVAREKMAALKVLPWEEQTNRLIIEWGERLFRESLGEARDCVQSILSEFEAALQTQRPQIIAKAAEKAKAAFEQFERW